MSDNLKKYLEEKKAAAARAKAPEPLQAQLVKDFARNADEKFKAVLPIANQVADELQGSGVLGVGLAQSGGLISGIALQLTVDEQAVKSEIKVESMGIQVTTGLPMPATAMESDKGIHIRFVGNSIDLADVNGELIRSLVKRMIDQLCP